MKQRIKTVKEYLRQSLSKVPQEFNELDWKEALSPKNKKLCQHVCAFANLLPGGCLVFGINSKTAVPQRTNKEEADIIVSDCQAFVVTESTSSIFADFYFDWNPERKRNVLINNQFLLDWFQKERYKSTVSRLHAKQNQRTSA